MLAELGCHAAVAFTIGVHTSHRQAQQERIIDDGRHVIATPTLWDHHQVVHAVVILFAITKCHLIFRVDIFCHRVETAVACHFEHTPESEGQMVVAMMILYVKLHFDIRAKYVAVLALLEEDLFYLITIMMLLPLAERQKIYFVCPILSQFYRFLWLRLKTKTGSWFLSLDEEGVKNLQNYVDLRDLPTFFTTLCTTIPPAKASFYARTERIVVHFHVPPRGIEPLSKV